MLIRLMTLGLFPIPVLTEGFLIRKKRKLSYDDASSAREDSALRLWSFLIAVCIFINFSARKTSIVVCS